MFSESAFQNSESLRLRVRLALVVARHPFWWYIYFKRGFPGLLTYIVERSIAQSRAVTLPTSLPELLRHRPKTYLGDLGATQDCLYFAVRILRPDVVVETGVFRGLSSALILAGLADNGKGHLYSIDLPDGSYRTDSGRVDSSNLPEGLSPGYVIPDSLRGRWSLRVGDAKTELPRLLDELGRIDVFYHDSEHTYEAMSGEFKIAYSHLSSHGVLLADDVSWNSAFLDFTRAAKIRWSTIIEKRLGVAAMPDCEA